MIDILGGLGAAAGLGGGIMSGIGALQAGRAQAQGYLNNMAIAGDQTAQEMFQFGRQKQAEAYAQNRLIGRQRAAYGAAGVSPYGGSPLDVMSDTQDQIKQQALNLAYAKQFTQTGAAAQGTADVDAANAAKKAASTSFLGDVIGGIGSMAKLLAPMFEAPGPKLVPIGKVDAGTGYLGNAGYYQPTVGGAVF